MTLMLVLDTDHASELAMRSVAGRRLLQRLDAAREDAVITAITVEEGMRGWLAEIRRHTDPAGQMTAYDHLVRQVELFAALDDPALGPRGCGRLQPPASARRADGNTGHENRGHRLG